MPDQHGQLARAGNHRDLAVFSADDRAHHLPKWTAVEAEMLRGLYQQPAGMGVTLLGDPTIDAVRARLMRGGIQAQVRSQLLSVRKAGDVPDGGHAGLGHGVVDAWNAHQKTDLFVFPGLPRQPAIAQSVFDLLLHF